MPTNVVTQVSAVEFFVWFLFEISFHLLMYVNLTFNKIKHGVKVTIKSIIESTPR